jgi:hypothetical protein
MYILLEYEEKGMENETEPKEVEANLDNMKEELESEDYDIAIPDID